MITIESESSNDRMMNADLHCHTNASDGYLSPEALMQRAEDKGVELLAITDHDCIEGYEKARACNVKVTLISGIELSSVWNGMGIHIVGLNFDSALISDAVFHQKSVRQIRTEKIAAKLEKKFKVPILQGVQELAGTAVVTRPHFAEYLVKNDFYKSSAEAFKKFLGAGKPGDVKSCWPTVPEVVNWILEAGGIPVLAHPHKYRLTNTKLKRLLGDFVESGGQAMEISVTGLNPNVRQYYSRLCQDLDLMGSRGSDFHTPAHQWCELGNVPPIPSGVVPVWSRFK